MEFIIFKGNISPSYELEVSKKEEYVEKVDQDFSGVNERQVKDSTKLDHKKLATLDQHDSIIPGDHDGV